MGNILHLQSKSASVRRPRPVNLAVIWIVLGLVIGFGGCDGDRQITQLALPIGHFVSSSQPHESIVPLSASGHLDAKSRLGKLLFHDARLSHDNTISCASCHDIANGGDDGRAFSQG